MTTITIVKRFLAQSPEEVLRNYRSYFALIDHGSRVSEIESKIESVRRIYDTKTGKLNKGFVDEFNRTILGLWEELYKANNYSYDSSTTFRFMLNADTDAYSTCSTVNGNVESNVACCVKSPTSYKPEAVEIAKRFMQFYNNSGVPNVVTYNSQLSKLASLNDDFMYQDAFKNYDMRRYVRELDNINIKQCFNNVFIEKSRRYEYVMMITINEIAELCKVWARKEKNEMTCPNEDIVKTIYALASCCYQNDPQTTSFGRQFNQFFKLDGTHGSQSDSTMICHIIIIAFDQQSNKFIFKQAN